VHFWVRECEKASEQPGDLIRLDPSYESLRVAAAQTRISLHSGLVRRVTFVPVGPKTTNRSGIFELGEHTHIDGSRACESRRFGPPGCHVDAVSRSYCSPSGDKITDADHHLPHLADTRGRVSKLV
jgi:hypothetical protein